MNPIMYQTNFHSIIQSQDALIHILAEEFVQNDILH